MVLYLCILANVAYSMDYANIDSVFVMRVKWNSEALYDPAFTCMNFGEEVNYAGYS